MAQGPESEAGREAALLAYKAHVARYGPLAADLARRMVQVSPMRLHRPAFGQWMTVDAIYSFA